MKKIALLFILGTISLGFFAQNYVPFPSSNASWIDIVFCDEHHYELVGDTVVNGVVYHALYLNTKAYTQGPTGCPNFNSYSIYGYYAGAYRNDSVNKKVFFLPPNLTRDTLLYDFNLSLGDSLPISYKNTLNYSNITLTVSRIDSVFLGGVYRKRFTFNYCAFTNTDSLKLIEGIGSNQNLLGDYVICDPWQTGTLFCFKQNSQIVYSHPNGTCQLITGLTEHSVEKFLNVSISPNPTNGVVKVESEVGIVSVEVFNLSGLRYTLLSLSLTNYNNFKRASRYNSAEAASLDVHSKSIDLTNLVQGIYFLKIELENGEVVSKKIIKQ